MSRLRTIKPGFFVDEYLAECQPLARILFAGLWTIADRAGRLEDRPKRIKVETLPYDDCDVDALLWELATHGFILRYEVDGHRFIAIPTWAKHQTPHVKEAASTIPAPDEPGASTRQEQCSGFQCGSVCESPANQLEPDEPGASTVPAQFFPPSSCLGSCLGSGIQEDPPTVPPDGGTVEDEPLEGEVVTIDPAAASFAAFWTAYPNKQGKIPAERHWRRMKPAERAAATEVATAMSYCVECGYRERDKCPHASTFLNQRRWEEWRDEDDCLRAPPGYGPAENGSSEAAHIDRVAARWAAEHEEARP